MKEKNTKGIPETNQGLNEENPNTERTPIDTEKLDRGLVGGTLQHNYEEERAGDAKRNSGGKEEGSRH